MRLSILCLAFITLTPNLGKVVIQTGAGEAEFYLDGTFVAKTNANGLLTIESFPDGSFGFAVKKPGFNTYEGSFTLSAGETKKLDINLRPIELSGPTSEVQGLRADDGPKSEVKPPAAKVEPNPSDRQQNETAGDSETGTWLVLATLILLPAFGSIAWKLYRKRFREVQGPEFLPDEEFMVATTPEEEQKWARSAPAFVEEIKRKEDLIKAGFIGMKAKQFDREAVAGKEKEIVILLPKESYHYEDEK